MSWWERQWYKMLTGNVTVGGTLAATTVTGANVTSGADPGHTHTGYTNEVQASGAPYNLTATPALLATGGTQPTLVLAQAGTYLLLGRVKIDYNGATFAVSRNVTLKLRRTNNTATDLISALVMTGIVTLETKNLCVGTFLQCIYTTANTTDQIELWGDVAVLPTAGTLDAVAGGLRITAVRLY